MLIVLEGLDGSGKATQTKLLVNYLKSQKYFILCIKSVTILHKIVSQSR